jgi:hypothetical protein
MSFWKLVRLYGTFGTINLKEDAPLFGTTMRLATSAISTDPQNHSNPNLASQKYLYYIGQEEN